MLAAIPMPGKNDVFKVNSVAIFDRSVGKNDEYLI
jgi:hypothetical protein